MGDAPRLFQQLVNEAAARYRRAAPEVTPADLAAVAVRDWPGNVRELRNAADRFVLGLGLEDAVTAVADKTLAEQVEAHERSLIAASLAEQGGNLKATYEALGLSRKTLYEKMQKHGLKKEDYGGADSQ